VTGLRVTGLRVVRAVPGAREDGPP
jgi:hypothetical protein